MRPKSLIHLMRGLFLACGMGSVAVAADTPKPATPFTVTAPADVSEDSQLTENAPDKDKSKKTKDDKNDSGKGEKAEPEAWHFEGLALKKGQNRIEPAGYAQVDLRHFDWHVKGDDGDKKRSPESELRRLRFAVEGQFGKVSFELAVDPRDSQRGENFKDTTLGYSFSKKLSLLVGHFKPPISQELLTSAGKTDFVERAILAQLAPDRDWGAAVSGEVGRIHYAIGGFAGDGDANAQSADSSFATRITGRVVKGLLVSGSYMWADVKHDVRVGNTEPAPKGTSGKAISGFTFWNRAHVNGNRERVGADMSYSRGPLRIRGEFLQEQEERKGEGSTGLDIPDVRGRGWAVGASYVLTGEKKGSTVEPAKSVFHGGKGALEIVARLEGAKFDDTGDGSGPAGYGNRARNIAPSGARAIEAGANYWLSNFMKFQGSALWESYNDPLIAPVPGKTGRYFSLLGRIQLMVP
ncbi:MAG: porin [Vicinamibacteria bacterium]